MIVIVSEVESIEGKERKWLLNVLCSNDVSIKQMKEYNKTKSWEKTKRRKLKAQI